tara:strand:- start:308 stop:472 length:165 start_codon:yes stop_codon:yes gene_type:complete
MEQRYVMIQKEEEKIIDSHVIWTLPTLKAIIRLSRSQYPEYTFEVYEIGKKIEL